MPEPAQQTTTEGDTPGENLDLFNLDPEPAAEPAAAQPAPAATNLPPAQQPETIINPELVQQVASQVGQMLAPQLQQTLAVERENEKTRMEFYKENPDLEGRDLVVGAIAQKFMELNPTASKKEAFETIAKASREYLTGPKVQTTQKTNSQLQNTGTNPPASAPEGENEIGALVNFANSNLRF